MKREKLDESIMEFVRLSIENPHILEDSEEAKNLAKEILIKNNDNNKEDEMNIKKSN